jgi:hypothetical protein
MTAATAFLPLVASTFTPFSSSGGLRFVYTFQARTGALPICSVVPQEGDSRMTILNPLAWFTKKRAGCKPAEAPRPQLTPDEMKALAAAFDRESWQADDKDASEKRDTEPGVAAKA